ncbi:MAG: hypothetical protein WAN22_05640, partial [Solirubrobacteraceae bacterium]
PDDRAPGPRQFAAARPFATAHAQLPIAIAPLPPAPHTRAAFLKGGRLRVDPVRQRPAWAPEEDGSGKLGSACERLHLDSAAGELAGP